MCIWLGPAYADFIVRNFDGGFKVRCSAYQVLNGQRGSSSRLRREPPVVGQAKVTARRAKDARPGTRDRDDPAIARPNADIEKKGGRDHKLNAGAKDLDSRRSLCAAFGAFVGTRSRQRLGRGTEAKRNTASGYVGIQRKEKKGAMRGDAEQTRNEPPGFLQGLAQSSMFCVVEKLMWSPGTGYLFSYSVDHRPDNLFAVRRASLPSRLD
jgi:hypothetical protein